MVAICASFGEGKHYEGKKKTPGNGLPAAPGQTTNTTPVRYLSLAERSMPFAAEVSAMSGPASGVRWTYACDDVRFERKGKPEVWITEDKVNGQMFVGYPSFSFIPGSQGVEEPTRYGDFDIDIDTQELACGDAVKILDWFEQVYGIDADQWRVYLSGKKGVHLELTAEILGTDGGNPYLTLGYKRLAKDIEGELQVKLDTSMFNMGTGKPYRQVNVIRDTGICKR